MKKMPLKLVYMGAIVMLIIGSGVYLAIHTSVNPQVDNHSEALLTHLTTIQKRLSTIEQVVSHTDSPNLEPIKQQLNLLSNRINQLQSFNPAQLTQTEKSYMNNSIPFKKWSII